MRSRRFVVPEAIQTSTMDCGPAALTSLLNGCGRAVSYARLREACQTDVDGTSIDTLEEIARSLGFPAEQVMVPVDHVLLDEASILPAIAVVRDPIGAAHFIVIWRCHGPYVQVMDPARGRLWLRRSDLLRQLYAHATIVPSDAWREWAGSEDFLAPLRRRLRLVGLSRGQADAQIAAALGDASWRRLGALDAATRMLAALRDARTLRGGDARATLPALVEKAAADPGSASVVPDHYWTVRPPTDDAAGTDRLKLRGGVFVRGRGAWPAAAPAPQSADLAAALTERPVRPLRDMIAAAREDGLLTPALAALAMGIAAASVVFEAVLLRSVFELATLLPLRDQRLAGGLALSVFVAIILGLELLLGSAERRIGGHLEARLRMTFLLKVPRLADSYFQSRPIADMVERSHSVHMLRMLPPLAIRFLRTASELFVTAIAVAWLAPRMAPVAIALAAAAAAIPLLGRSLVAERDLRVRTHAGALGRFHLDALLGRTAIDAHSAGPTIEREHDRLLGEWIQASAALHRSTIAGEGLQTFIGFGLAAWLLFGQFSGGNVAGMLLLTYWVLNLPWLGYEMAVYAKEYPAHRSTMVRILELLSARQAAEDEESAARGDDAPIATGQESRAAALPSPGVRIDARGVSVRAAGHRILDGISVAIEPGSHVAIVGSSGAGKSTLASLFLGWHQAAEGELLVDGTPLTAERFDALRRETAWVDPTVQIWNRSLIDNLTYGSDAPPSIAPILDAADLTPVIAKLPDGLATMLGENGSLLSAGEAQRVRLGRAMTRRDARLVILDEPFVGLERDRRRRLLARARRHWHTGTLLYVTHDVNDALGFDRVLVLDGGRIVEDGAPAVLAQRNGSRLRALLDAHHRVDARFEADGGWQRIRLEAGRVSGNHAYRSNEHAS